ncbi:unnamed protein product [Nezara viridula]|uniref:DPH-type MB domain-containing protein n=1 Tax=Nezara viridula TaxID=85310 RepID=A0A9P0HHN6_NEZVI|nr:unnamed protein product [Nezara viridula]
MGSSYIPHGSTKTKSDKFYFLGLHRFHLIILLVNPEDIETHFLTVEEYWALPNISLEELAAGEEIATCPSCSLIIKVIYDIEKFSSEAEEIKTPKTKETIKI